MVLFEVYLDHALCWKTNIVLTDGLISTGLLPSYSQELWNSESATF